MYADDGLYRLAAGDTISITVYGEDDLSIDGLKIDNRESVDYPYLGTISLANKTLGELKDELLKGLKGAILVNPKVNVSIVSYRNVYVNGMVNKPGAYEYEPGLTVQQAVSLAGGILTKYRRSAKNLPYPKRQIRKL
ncbi:polysaccharide biosynthesis/export family protein [Vibrio sinaloensis]|nr:polysaccharide biosynthesis/export family protein [Vibrio sinaloensis]